MRIIVVGAGIGGATLALALERAGLDYVVLEQAPALTEVGAGIQLSPNGVRVLDWLGLADDLAEFCAAPRLQRAGASVGASPTASCSGVSASSSWPVSTLSAPRLVSASTDPGSRRSASR